jgi:hypothetical protein
VGKVNPGSPFWTFWTSVGPDEIGIPLFPFPDLSAHAVTVEVPVIVDESAASSHNCKPVKDFGVNVVEKDGSNLPG